jgi:hypothetical protein
MFQLSRLASRLIVFRWIGVLTFTFAMAMSSFAAQAQTDRGQDKHLDIQSSAGDLHMGNDADARKAGLELYPGARVHKDKSDNDAVNLGLFTQAFGVKLVVAKYESDDSPEKVIAFYRDQLKKYGKVLECHTREHSGYAHEDFDDESSNSDKGAKKSNELKCEGDNSGPVTELKVGKQDDQHVVAIEPASKGKDGHGGSTFALVYVRTRGKQGDL